MQYSKMIKFSSYDIFYKHQISMYVYNWYAKHHIPISENVGGVIRTNKVPFMQYSARKKLS